MNRRITRGHALIGAVAVCCLLVAPIAVAQSVGGPEATASGVKKQVKKLKKQVNELQAQVDEVSKQPGPQGPPGQRGAAGEDATNLFAYIRDPGPFAAEAASVHYGSGVTAVSDPAGHNGYTVTFNRSVVNCVIDAVAGPGDPGGNLTAFASFPYVDMREGDANTVGISFIDPGAATTDTSFLITAFC